MEFSTLIILAIAIFVIIYRIKTWNTISSDNAIDNDSKDVIAEQVVEYKIDDTHVEPVQKKSTKKSSPDKNDKKTSSKYKKTLNATQNKNKVLVDGVNNSIKQQYVFEIASQPREGVKTLVTLVDKYSTTDRAVGLIYEQEADKLTIIKSFDVKMQANEQFKIATSFSKSLSIKRIEMNPKSLQATHLFIKDDERLEVSQVSLTLK